MNKELMLNKIKEHYGIDSDSDFARFLGITPQTLHNWKKRNTFDIPLVYTKCVNLSAEWLITGTGNMLQSENLYVKTLIAAEPSMSYQKTDWQSKYEHLHEKYTELLEENNKLLKNKLNEVLSDVKKSDAS